MLVFGGSMRTAGGFGRPAPLREKGAASLTCVASPLRCASHPCDDCTPERERRWKGHLASLYKRCRQEAATRFPLSNANLLRSFTESYSTRCLSIVENIAVRCELQLFAFVIKSYVSQNLCCGFVDAIRALNRHFVALSFRGFSCPPLETLYSSNNSQQQ